MQPTTPGSSPTRLSLAAAALVCLAASVGSPWPSVAAELAARYDVATTGIAIGRADLSLSVRAAEVAARFSFENGPLLGLIQPSLTRMRSTLRRGAGAAAAREPTPLRYEALFRKDGRDRDVTIGYAGDGGVDSFRLVKRGQARVTGVPAELPPGAVDPLAALVRLRSWLERAMTGDTAELDVFDGRKLYRTSLRYLGPVQMTQYGDRLAAHRVTASYRQVAQLDEDDGDLRAEGDRQRTLDVLLSADGRYLPLRVSGSFDGFPLTAEIAADCLTPAGCAVDER